MPEKRRTRLFMGRNRKTTSEHLPECEDFRWLVASRFSHFHPPPETSSNGEGLIPTDYRISQFQHIFVYFNELFIYVGAGGDAPFKESAISMEMSLNVSHRVGHIICLRLQLFETLLTTTSELNISLGLEIKEGFGWVEARLCDYVSKQRRNYFLQFGTNKVPPFPV